jgi:hypothetical protein
VSGAVSACRRVSKAVTPVKTIAGRRTGHRTSSSMPDRSKRPAAAGAPDDGIRATGRGRKRAGAGRGDYGLARAEHRPP